MRIFPILLFIICSTTAFGQFDQFECSESFTIKESSPVIERRIYDRLVSDDAIIYLGCYFTTDTAGKITSRRFIPFNGMGNQYNTEDSIWTSIEGSLSRASINWVFKPSLWQFKDNPDYASKLNKATFQRPYHGKPSYFFVFEISGIGSEGTLFPKIAFRNFFKVGK